MAARTVNPAKSWMKYYGTELNKLRHELTLSARGSAGLEWDGGRSDDGAAVRAWLRTNDNFD